MSRASSGSCCWLPAWCSWCGGSEQVGEHGGSGERGPEALAPARVARSPAELALGERVGGPLRRRHRCDSVAAGEWTSEPRGHAPRAWRAERGGERGQPLTHGSWLVIDDVVG